MLGAIFGEIKNPSYSDGRKVYINTQYLLHVSLIELLLFLLQLRMLEGDLLLGQLTFFYLLGNLC